MQQEPILFPGRVPTEVKTMIKSSKSMEKSVFRKMIKLALGYLQGSLTSEECETAVQNICQASQADTEETVLNVCIQYAGILTLLRSALRVNTVTTRQENLSADLSNLGLPEDFASDICKVVFGPARPDIDRQLRSTAPSLPVLTNMNWRVEVTISTSWLSRVLEPVVMLRLELNNGSSFTFQVPVAKFHHLRYTVANILHQMEDLQTSSICKK